MLDLSIIIPIYNTPAADLQRCFDSIDPDAAYEVLLIDDGSGPAVEAFCRDYIKSRPAFSYVRKENGGVSSARNLGIDLAKGRYLTFVDADDTIFSSALAHQLPRQQDGPDMIFSDILLTQQGIDSVWSAFPLPEGSLDRQQVLYQLFTNSSISGPVAKLYKTRLLQQAGLRFNTEFVSGEDWLFVCDCMDYAETFRYVPACTYRYFRQAATGLGRIARFPDKMIHNQLARYERKKQVIAKENWTICTAGQVLHPATVQLVENLFNTAADLLLCKQYTPSRKAEIRQAVIAAAPALTGQLPKKTRLKLQVLTRFPIGLRPLAILRRIHLK